MPTAATRLPFSRAMFIAPLVWLRWANWPNGTCAPEGVATNRPGSLSRLRWSGASLSTTEKWRSPSHSSELALPASAVSITSWMSPTFRP